MEHNNENSIEGFVDSIVFRNEDNGYTVFNIICNGSEVTCVGVLSYINEGEFIAATGEYVMHPIYLQQFKITSYEIRVPEDIQSVKRYLGSGAIKGIGEKLAESIIKKFGEDTFRIIEDEPERLAEIKGISVKKAMEIADQLVEKKDMRKAMMFLQEYGINMNLANKIYTQYGNDIYRIIKENPYKLADDINGIGFKIADEIAQRVGVKSDSDFRIRSGIMYELLLATTNGHVYLPMKELINSTRQLLLIDMVNIDKFIMDLSIDKKIIVKQVKDQQVVYASSYYYTELSVAGMLVNLDIKYSDDDLEVEKSIGSIEKSNEMILDGVQRQAVKDAILNGLMVITGGPGTGKTTTINTIIKYFEIEGMDIRLAAPTGRAAKRMSETTGYEAQTIHRMLELSGNAGDNTAAMNFERNELNPLETDVIIIDEMSMVDINLMNSLLKAIAVGTRLILVGDVDQLPSVGPGNVLKDIIQSGCVNVVMLTKIFRQAATSEIIINAHKINNGEEVILNKYSKDFLFIKRDNPESITGAICTLIRDKLPDYVNAKISDIQILTPMKKGAVGVEKLNKILQEFLNPAAKEKTEKEYGDTVFKVGDKVMQVKNNYQLEWEKRSKYGIPTDGGTGIFNGDIGIIETINLFSEQMIVKFDDEKYVEYSFKQLEELELAYAVTIHKSQGSEYPAVIIPMFSGPKMLMTRNLLYTAVTRAKTCVCIVGSQNFFQEMIRNVSEQMRYSTLAERIKEMQSIAD
ncbi:SF1B family DNA helicase RecD2 [[Clostridium] fimetarium]|uniref:ATP-dependent RecD2 DNA helicase n=1 Tax=[Clostridium] fimetarium TaxID=99656 RepID=A0A1I0P3F0_9FIRM|nr:ATP-dependent RecD-like DNA helicase [[Clostridium] fimetarium]SEW08741.1 exodeoxyribonuclease V alpha subunit [[Clostridium] fimetarium]